ncbi:MAG: hypothetical protein INH41_16640 [Myxococcaceae bacterium]|nr:hypothetical protein [Myxococcaceae bacterium]MCA3014010.1 hypothetical protein [Myxococcaceae bacterium]
MSLLTRALASTCLVATLALADDASDKALALNRQGTALAEQGRFDEAIERFKAAEALLPRYQHHCNIGIAYQDSGRLPQALRFLQSCVARAGKNASPASRTRLATLEARLTGAPWGRLIVEGAQLRVAIAPWADEEWVVDGQRTFVLEAGATTLLARRRDGTTFTRAVTVTPGTSLTVSLEAPPAAAPVTPPPSPTAAPLAVATPDRPSATEPPAPRAEPTSAVTTPSAPPVPSRPVAPWLLAGAGAVLVIIGAVAYALAAPQTSTFPASTPEAGLSGYRALVVTTYSGWGLGGVALVGGLVWGLSSSRPPPVTLAPAAGPGGALSLTLGALW